MPVWCNEIYHGRSTPFNTKGARKLSGLPFKVNEKILVVNPEGMTPIGIPKRRWNDTIKTDSKTYGI
jgi:hypothetical protein